MTGQTEEALRRLAASAPPAFADLSLEDLKDLLDTRDIRATDYELLQLAVAWYKAHWKENTLELKDLVEELDFSKMTSEQVGCHALMRS
jgi:hypothetical protein